MKTKKFYRCNGRGRLWIRGGRSHFFRLRLRSCSKIFESGSVSGSGNFSNVRIRLLFRLRLQSRKPKITNGLTLVISSQTPATTEILPKLKSDSAPVPNFWILIRVRKFFKFENPTPVQTPITIIDPTVIYPCFHLRKNHRDSCYCRNGRVTLDLGPVFHKFLAPGPKEKRRILPESTPALRILYHLCFECVGAAVRHIFRKYVMYCPPSESIERNFSTAMHR